MTTPAQEAFLVSAPGKRFDVDGYAGAQCKDLVDAYCLAIFGDWINTVRPGNGKDVFGNANPKYFRKVQNNPADPNQVPPRGAITSYTGTRAVPEGHTEIVLKASSAFQDVIYQDGYDQGPTRTRRDDFTIGDAQLIGWLEPILANARPSQCIVDRGDTMFSIAVQFGVPVQALINANPQVKNPNVIQPGWVLTLP